MRLKRLSWRRILSLALLLGLISIIAFLHTRAMRLVRPFRSQTTLTPTDFGIDNWQSVHFTTADGLELAGWFILPEPDKAGATIVFIHGLGSYKGDLLPQAQMVISEGYGALLFDLRAHGESEGGHSSWGKLEIRDIEAALSFLQTQPTVDSGRIALIGHSMGGAIVLQAAATLPNIQAVIIESSYTTLADNSERLTVSFARLPDYSSPIIMPWAAYLAGVDLATIRPIDDIAQLSVPILLIHGKQDSTIPVTNSQQLYVAANEPKRLFMIAEADHSSLLASIDEELRSEILSFLDKYL